MLAGIGGSGDVGPRDNSAWISIDERDHVTLELQAEGRLSAHDRTGLVLRPKRGVRIGGVSKKVSDGEPFGLCQL